MNSDKEKLLTDKFPILYRGINRPITENLLPFGFECDDGWFNIIWDLSEKLSNLNEDIIAMQVKEKYATLRFYITGGSDKAFALIDEAEGKSSSTCEICGKGGTIMCKGIWWVKTLCDIHYSEWINEKKI